MYNSIILEKLSEPGSIVTVKKKFVNDKYFTLFGNGSVLVHLFNGDQYEVVINSSLSVDDVLKIRDLELFNIVQIVKHGYLALSTDSYDKVKDTITKLFVTISDMEYNRLSGNDIDNFHPVMCGSTLFDDNGFTDDISYHASSGIEVQVRAIPRFVKHNRFRKRKGYNCIPFNKNVDLTNTISVMFVTNMSRRNYPEIREKCNETLAELVSLLKLGGEQVDLSNWTDMTYRNKIYYEV